jgi:hypothetical protein
MNEMLHVIPLTNQSHGNQQSSSRPLLASNTNAALGFQNPLQESGCLFQLLASDKQKPTEAETNRALE